MAKGVAEDRGRHSGIWVGNFHATFLAIVATCHAPNPEPPIIQETTRDGGCRSLLRIKLFKRAAASEKPLILS
jgi:hypothetical protein